MPEVQCSQGAGAGRQPHQPCDKASETPSEVAAAAESTTNRPSQLESKLDELTQRLNAAEEASKHHCELHTQLQQLKQDKTALQSDLKHFMQHTSCMLTTLQSQISRLMVAGPASTQQPAADQGRKASALEHAEQGSPGQHAGAAEVGCMAGASRPTALGQARSNLPEAWRLESHGDQPSPLARHEIFERPLSALQSAQHTSAGPKELAGQQAASWIDELKHGLSRSPQQVPSQWSAAIRVYMSGEHSCVYVGTVSSLEAHWYLVPVWMSTTNCRVSSNIVHPINADMYCHAPETLFKGVTSSCMLVLSAGLRCAYSLYVM